MCALKASSIPTPPRKQVRQGNFEAWQVAWEEAYRSRDFARAAAWEAEATWQAAALRDLLGSLFHPVSLDPTWLAWGDGTVTHLAQGILAESHWEDIPILGDALEEAGCDSGTILTHLRSPGLHIRGCWVLDLILGKE